MRAILRTLRSITLGLLLALLGLLRSLLSLVRRKRGGTSDDAHERRRARTQCVPIDDPAYVRPDPVIYDQYFLAGLGFNVTWDNPDFAVFLKGVPVSSHDLHENTNYDVVVRVWNGSKDCPVVMMPVHLSYLSFGVGTVSHPIDTQLVDVGVKGTPTNPSFARFVWRTPPTPGHYCLQALLDPVADEEFGNNLGQHNTDVVETHSPGTFVFSLRNGGITRRQFSFDVDTYALGPIGPCSEDPADLERRQAYHRGEHPLPAGWSVDVVPPAPVLDVVEEIPIAVTVTPPGGWTGSQAINVHTYYLDGGGIQRPAGGVTLTVTAS